jgi:diguanylate cyclase (GGDEF)-like protein
VAALMAPATARASLKATRAALARSRAEVGRLTRHVGQLRCELAEARIDPLTGLPTRAPWLDQAERAISRTSGTGHHYVLLLDLMRFKAVNDEFGHAAGDALLQCQAERLNMWARGHGQAGRLGGDELVAVVTLDARDVGHELDHLGTILSKPMVWDRRRVTSPAAIGVALASGHELEVLLAAADRAMYRAKADHGPAWWRFADPDEYTAPETAPVHRARHRDVRTPTAER